MISRKYLYLLVGLLSATIFKAQNVHFGLKGGLNISTLTVSGASVKGNLSYKPGFHIGGLIHSSVSKEFSVQTEFLYSNQGYKYDEGSYEMIGNIDYLAVPVMMMYYPVKKFSIEAGPQLSILLTHKAEIDKNQPYSYANNSSVDLRESTEGIELGMNLGLGYKVDQNLFFSGRYNFGLTTVNKKESASGTPTSEEDRNSVFQFSIGYLF